MEQWSRASAPALQRIIKAAYRWEWWRAGKAGATRWMVNQPAGKSSLLYWRVQNISLRDLWSCRVGGERATCSDIMDGNFGFAYLSSCLCVVSRWFTNLICMTILGTFPALHLRDNSSVYHVCIWPSCPDASFFSPGHWKNSHEMRHFRGGHTYLSTAV